MNIDKETEPSFINIVLSSDKKVLEELKEQANNDMQNNETKAGESKKMSITNDNRLVDVEEYYFDNGTLHYSANLRKDSGDIWYSFELPLSDKVLIDILEHSNKRFNKLKTVLESLK